MSGWSVLALGLLLGIRHAFDADHLVAVTTIVSEYKNPLRAIWIGVSWGLGHTTTLFLAGIILLLLDVRMPERLALAFEFGVGVMLILLGVQAFLSVRRLQFHTHAHEHAHSPSETHEHFHIHGLEDDHAHPTSRWERLGRLLTAGITPGESADEQSASRMSAANRDRKVLKPVFRLKSYLVGIVHGLAGSAALMLVVLASIESAWTGAAYILLFGLGTVISMGIVSTIISLPFSFSGRIPSLNRIIQAATGTASILFGLWLMYEVGIGEGLFIGV